MRKEREEVREWRRRIEHLAVQLEKELTFDEHVIWGHGTITEERAGKINKEGIVVSSNYGLLEIAVPLSLLDLDSKANARVVAKETLTWFHRQAKYVALLGLPFGFKQDQVMENIFVNGQEKSSVPNRFIEGYVDAQLLRFIDNPDFMANPEPTKGLGWTGSTWEGWKGKVGSKGLVIPQILENPESDVW